MQEKICTGPVFGPPGMCVVNFSRRSVQYFSDSTQSAMQLSTASVRYPIQRITSAPGVVESNLKERNAQDIQTKTRQLISG